MWYCNIGAGGFGEVILSEYVGTKVVVKRLLRSRISEGKQSLPVEIIIYKFFTFRQY